MVVVVGAVIGEGHRSISKLRGITEGSRKSGRDQETDELVRASCRIY